MKKTELFDYQEEMKSRIEGAFSTHQSVMVQMPTGTGKTHLLAAVVKSEESKCLDCCASKGTCCTNSGNACKI